MIRYTCNDFVPRFYLILFIVIFLSPSIANSQCISGDCENGKGIYVYPDKTKADCFWKNGKPEGQCNIFYSSGASYVGQMTQGRRNGIGKYTYPSGSFEEGKYINDSLIGFVTINYADGSKYIGNWSNGKKNGNGKYTQSNGYSEEGNYYNDSLSGNVTITYSNGDKYVGFAKNAAKEGKGVYYFSSGDKFEGNYKNNLRSGDGTLYYAKGGTLKGTWLNGEYISGSNNSKNLNENAIIPFLNNGGVYEVNTYLNNVLKLDMIFDTGAGEVQFSRDIFQTLIKTKTISVDDILEGGYYEDANGNINYNVRFNLRQLKIGKAVLENIPCCVAKDEKGSNLLGLSALKKLGKFEFDFDKAIIYLK